jgi:hypothetical protein
VIISLQYDAGEPRQATLIFRVDESTSRSRFLAHYSFTKSEASSPSSSETALQIRGGKRVINASEENNGEINYDGKKKNEISVHLRKLMNLARDNLSGLLSRNTLA